MCGCRNKWRGPPGAHEAGGAPWTLVARWWLPLVCSQCRIFLNKAKIVFYVCFPNYPCNKKYPKNKSSPNALKFKYHFFLEYLRIFGTENTVGGSTTCPRGWRARPTPLGAPPCLVVPRWPSSTYPFTHTLLLPPSNTNIQLKHEF